MPLQLRLVRPVVAESSDEGTLPEAVEEPEVSPAVEAPEVLEAPEAQEAVEESPVPEASPSPEAQETPKAQEAVPEAVEESPIPKKVVETGEAQGAHPECQSEPIHPRNEHLPELDEPIDEKVEPFILTQQIFEQRIRQWTSLPVDTIEIIRDAIECSCLKSNALSELMDSKYIKVVKFHPDKGGQMINISWLDLICLTSS